MQRNLRLLRQAFEAVVAFKLRALFCLLSVALGIAAITIIVAATEGTYQQAYQIVDQFGPDALLILGGSEEMRAIGHRDKTISLDDVAAIREAFPTAYLVVPLDSAGRVTVVYQNHKYRTRLTGATSGYSRAWSWPITEGVDFSENDVRGLRNVALIGVQVEKELFPDQDPIGKYILVKGMPVQVIGVLAARGMTGAGHNLDDRIIMPLSTLMRKIENELKYVYAVRIRFLDGQNIERHTEELRRLLRLRHHLREGQPDDFRILSPKEIIRFLVALSGSLIVFLGITGFMSLIVAGFVLANLFLLSVQERVHEIGIRRSVGARRGDILRQFLAEAVILTSLGGLLGFLLGLGGSRLLMLLARFPIYFSWKAFVAGLVLSVAVGLVFGLQPAKRAAQMNPIDAIRGG